MLETSLKDHNDKKRGYHEDCKKLEAVKRMLFEARKRHQNDRKREVKKIMNQTIRKALGELQSSKKSLTVKF